MFGINFNNVVVWLIPKVLRTSFNVAWLKALVVPVVTVYNQLLTFKDEVLYKLSHNGQVCHLQGALNDTFDISLRRIYISDAGGDVVTLIHRDTDEKVLVLQDDTAPFTIHNDSAYFGGSYDFIVNIPYQFSEADMYRLRALVDYYKLAGKRYDVVINS